MSKILPILLALIGVGAGIGAGVMLKPAPVDMSEVPVCRPATEGEHTEVAHDVDEGGEATPPEYVKMHNQFVIPVVEDGKMAALVVLSISLKVSAGGKEATFSKRTTSGGMLFNQILV